ncbi:SLAP domain-containing protein [Lactobacillus johnsonii]|uniref:SLAP domain-containing protein n=1 Tax=Lactobacillus johnsonii TaxID=33959 RepID=UPI001434033D|nr:SLAP domain-containing protein [Lactobacillus johnsonii]GFI20063.1 levansucrase [Lactobacillus johnsonii]
MNKKSLLKTALVSAAILSGAGLFANTTQAQAATPATHAEQVRGVLKVVDHENHGEVHLYDRDGHVMKQTVKNGKKYKVWEKAYINDELMYRIGTDKQWIPAKYTDWKDAKLGQNVAVASKATNAAYNRENYVGVATINYQGSGNVRLVNSRGNYTSQYLPKNSTWKVWEKADINHEPMYRVGNQSQWVPAKYITVSQTNTENSQNSGVHTSGVGNNTNKPTSVATHESTQRPVDNSTHSSKGLPQGNVSAGNSSSTSNSSHNTANTTPETPVTPVKPATSSKPADTKPTEPAKPAVPTKPVDTKPVQPVTPTEPAKPAKPEVPATPAEPSKPADTTPAKPVAPATTVKPAEPAKPVTPTQPTKPAKPTTPTDNSNQALTTSQMDQVFWNGYMAPNGYQRGTMTREEYDNYTGSSTSSYMTLHNYHYVNTDASKKEFLQDTKETADQYEWNNARDADGNKFQKASLQVTQTSPDDIRIDAIWYN